MRVIDEITEQEIFDEPDLTVGELFYNPAWVSRAAYERAEAEGLPAVLDSDYEEVLIYHVWSEDELIERESRGIAAEFQEIMDSLPDAFADLSGMVSDNTVDMADVMDAIAELSEIVSKLMEGE